MFGSARTIGVSLGLLPFLFNRILALPFNVVPLVVSAARVPFCFSIGVVISLLCSFWQSRELESIGQPHSGTPLNRTEPNRCDEFHSSGKAWSIGDRSSL